MRQFGNVIFCRFAHTEELIQFNTGYAIVILNCFYSYFGMFTELNIPEKRICALPRVFFFKVYKLTYSI